MANFFEPSDRVRAEWVAWVETRPGPIRAMLKRTGIVPSAPRGSACTWRPSRSAPPAVSVYVSGEFNLVAMERRVFGVSPDDLAECDLPKPGEVLGNLGMSLEEVRGALREMERRRN